MAQITPQEILDISEPIEAVYQRTVDELLINIARHFEISGWERTRYWEIKKLSEMGALTKESAAIIAKNTKMLPAEIEKAFLQVSEKACKDIDPQLKQAAEQGLLQDPQNTPSTSVLMRQQVQSYVDQAVDKANLINTTMLESTRQAYANGITTAVNTAMLAEAKETLEAGALSVVTGVETRTMAIRKAMNNIVNTGIAGFYDRAGRKWSPDAYAAMVIRTTAHNAAISAIRTRQEEFGGGDIFQVSSHPAARPLCYPYQGKFFSWSGDGVFTDGAGHKHEYKDISESSYGEPAGLFGINCGHHPIPMIDGFSYPQDGPEETEEENRKAYEESQKQRQYERDIREAKRDLAVAEATGDTEAIKAAKQKVAQEQAKMRAYVKETGRPRRYDREAIGGEKIPEGYKGFRAQSGSDIPLDGKSSKGYNEKAFKAASTREDAIKASHEFADRAKYTTATTEQINLINETLFDLTSKYPIEKYGFITENNRMRAAGKSCYKTLELRLKATDEKPWHEVLESTESARKALVAMYGENIPAKYKKQMKEWDEWRKFSRWTTCEMDDVRGTILHEYAHTLSDQYFGMINGKRANRAAMSDEAVERRSLVRVAYHRALSNGDIYKISCYAKTNADEFLAETFTMREMGEELPDYINHMLNEVFNGRVQDV